MPLSWVNPICSTCATGYKLNGSIGDPLQVLPPNSEPALCCMCGNRTSEGFYIRLDPYKVKYPRVIPERRKLPVRGSGKKGKQ